jgi:adenine phosphoribosyltransferase
MESLINKAGGKVLGKAAILAEGDSAERKDIIYLERLPVFTVKHSR